MQTKVSRWHASEDFFIVGLGIQYHKTKYSSLRFKQVQLNLHWTVRKRRNRTLNWQTDVHDVRLLIYSRYTLLISQSSRYACSMARRRYLNWETFDKLQYANSSCGKDWDIILCLSHRHIANPCRIKCHVNWQSSLANSRPVKQIMDTSLSSFVSIH